MEGSLWQFYDNEAYFTKKSLVEILHLECFVGEPTNQKVIFLRDVLRGFCGMFLQDVFAGCFAGYFAGFLRDVLLGFCGVFAVCFVRDTFEVFAGCFCFADVLQGFCGVFAGCFVQGFCWMFCRIFLRDVFVGCFAGCFCGVFCGIFAGIFVGCFAGFCRIFVGCFCGIFCGIFCGFLFLRDFMGFLQGFTHFSCVVSVFACGNPCFLQGFHGHILRCFTHFSCMKVSELQISIIASPCLPLVAPSNHILSG